MTTSLQEQKLGQKFIVDAHLSTCLRQAGKTDNIDETINYAHVYQDIKTIVEGKPYQLIETVAEKIAEQILHHYVTVDTVVVTVKKPHVALAGVVEYLGIQVQRAR